MTPSRQWLVFGAALSVGMGFVGGMMVCRREADPVIGRLWEVGGEVYVDAPLVDFLTSRADSWETIRCSEVLPCPGEWRALRYRTAVLFFKKFVEGLALPRQCGALFTLRSLNGDSTEARNDREVEKFMQAMIDLGLVERVGRWRSWVDVQTPRRPERRL